MNEKILEKLETLIDKTLDAAISDRGLKTNPAQSVRVIETVADVLRTINEIETRKERAVKYSPVINYEAVEKDIKRSFNDVIKELQHGCKPDITTEGLKDD